ncbi:MAG: MFS transporter [Chloroflexi bacterium]|nr:MFS transporter [Chloroflexota bacterium]
MVRHWLGHFSSSLWLLIVTAAGASLCLSVFSVVFNLYASAAGVTPQALGIINAATAIGSGIAILPTGLIANRWGRKRTLICGGILFASGSLLQSTTEGTLSLTFGGFLAGAGGAIAEVLTIPIFLEYAASIDQGLVLSVSGAAQVAAGALGSALGGILPSWWNHFTSGAVRPLRFTLLTALAAALVPALIFLFRYHDTPNSPSVQLPSPWRQSSWTAQIARGSAIVGTVGLGAGLTIPYLNLYFIQRLHSSLAEYGLLVGLTSLSVALGTLLAGPLIRRFGVPSIMIATQGIATALLVALAYVRVHIYAQAIYLLRNTAMDMAQPAATGWLIHDLPPALQPLGYGILLIAFQLPWALGSSASGFIRAYGGFKLTFAMTSLCYFISTLLWIIFFVHHNSREKLTETQQTSA